MSTAVFGALGFRAQSGRMVKQGEDGSVSFHLGNGYIGADVAMDAEEFFQAKRDAELGRWRVATEPDYVVYPRYEDGYDLVLVVCETDGTHAGYDRHDFPTTDSDQWLTHRAAAAAYFEAHPKRKPWADAKEGEGWIVTIGGEERLATVQESYFWIGSEAYRKYGDDVTAARKVWPEDAS